MKEIGIADGGKPIYYGDDSYIYDGIYNPIVWMGKYPYRPRVETLVIKDGNKVFLRIYDKIKNGSWYTLPGGSVDADSTKIEQARNETNEEALIDIRDIHYTGISYITTYTPGFNRNGGHSPVEYVGTVNDVFVAAYDRPYDKSKVEPKDLDPDIADNGKFYPIEDVLDKLLPDHLRALQESPLVNQRAKMKINVRIANESTVVVESMNPDFANIPAPGDFIYHGSRYKFDVFHPMSIDFGNATQKPGWSTFCFGEMVLALRFALMRTIQSCISGKGLEKCQWYFKENRPYIYAHMARTIFPKIIGQKFYVYHIPTEGLAIGIGNDIRFPEYTFREDNVRPKTIQTFTIDDGLLDAHLAQLDMITAGHYEKEELSKYEMYQKRHHAAFINHDYANDPKIKKVIQAVEEKRLNPGDNIERFMIEHDLVPEDLDWKIPISEATSIKYSKKKIDRQSLYEYKKKYPKSMLEHMKSPDDTNQGYFIIGTADNLIGYTMVDTKRHMIVAIEVEDAYKSLGFGKVLLDIATGDLDAKYLTVNKKNIPAINLYKKWGWDIYKETDSIYFMSAPGVTFLMEGMRSQPSEFSAMEPTIETRLVRQTEDPVKVLVDFITELRSWTYGYLLPNGTVMDRNKDRKNFIDKYRTLSLREFEKCKCGICFDYVYYTYDKLTKDFRRYGYKPECYYIETNYPDGYRACHTFIIVDINHKYYWADCTWTSPFTLTEYTSKKRLLDEIIAGWDSAHDVKHRFIKRYIPNASLVGLSFYEFMNKVGGYIPELEPIEESSYACDRPWCERVQPDGQFIGNSVLLESVDIDELEPTDGEKSYGTPPDKSREPRDHYEKFVVNQYFHHGEYFGLLDWEKSIDKYIEKKSYGMGLYYVYGSNQGYPEYIGQIIVKSDKTWYWYEGLPMVVTESKSNSSEKQVLESLTRQLSRWKYGYVKGNRVMSPINDDSDFVKNYRTLSVAEFERYKCGTCFDYVNYIYYRMVELYRIYNDYDTICYYIEGETPDGDHPCHVIPVIRLKNTDLYYWMETAWKSNAGLFEYKNPKRLLVDFVKKWLKSNHLNDYAILCEYVPRAQLVGVDCFTFMTTVNKNTEIKHTEIGL
ncbi:MAG: GNAT family N-acetyltransferase [Lachnospiraceae bacterium]|nr:GNAT family N-acetyltransferase [Lachnospiraceae bacterium]